jgi:acetylornithine deacetylase
VVDEEWQSAGTKGLLERGVRADACIVTEPTRLAIAPAHKGFTWTEITFSGRAAHGSRYDVGVDAIRHAGLFLSELDRLEREELVRHTHPLLGHASLHAATIAGGTGWSTYPDQCLLAVERRTVPGEAPDAAVAEMERALSRVTAETPAIQGEVRHVFPSGPATSHPTRPSCGRSSPRWTPSANARRSKAFGVDRCRPAERRRHPGDLLWTRRHPLAHSATEWVAEAEITRATSVLERLALDWCGAA